jgi:hypothetical protein
VCPIRITRRGAATAGVGPIHRGAACRDMLEDVDGVGIGVRTHRTTDRTTLIMSKRSDVLLEQREILKSKFNLNWDELYEYLNIEIHNCEAWMIVVI